MEKLKTIPGKTEAEMRVKANSILECFFSALESFYALGYSFKLDALKDDDEGNESVIAEISSLRIRVEKIGKSVDTHIAKIGIGSPIDAKSPQEMVDEMRAILTKIPSDSSVFGSVKLFINT